MDKKELKGFVERLTEKGFICAGSWVGYSKFYKGTRFTDEHIGCPVTLVVHEYQDRLYADRVTALGDKDPNFTPSAPPSSEARTSSGSFRRLDPEELELKKLEGPRISRSVALQWATTYGVQKDLSFEGILALASAFARFVFTGEVSAHEASPGNETPKSPGSEVPPAEPTQASEKTPNDAGTRTDSRWKGKDTKTKVNDLFNVARAAGIVENWPKWTQGINLILGRELGSPYDLTPDEYAQVEAFVRDRLKVAKVA